MKHQPLKRNGNEYSDSQHDAHLKKKKRRSVWISLFITILAVGVAFYLFYSEKGKKQQRSHQELTVEPKFIKEGELTFINRSDTSRRTKIDIEIADDETSRNRGLMYRRTLAQNQGMLFIFSDEAPRNFWMENTYLPLDIIFINSKKEIIHIHRNAVPFSEASIPSMGKAQYVVEVNAGFTEHHKINTGDKIFFQQIH